MSIILGMNSKATATRYLLLTCLYTLILFGGFHFHHATPVITDVLFMILFMAMFNLRYVIYDALSHFFIRRIKKKILIVHRTFYVFAVLVDIIFVYLSTLDNTDAGFALFGLISITPWILLIGITILGLQFLKQIKKS